MAHSSDSAAVLITCSSSRNHCIAAPATNTLPSRAYCTLSLSLAAIVVNKPWLDWIASSPVFISRKQPVPYVFLHSPGSKQPCPNNAACWSPATPAMGISLLNTPGVVNPYTQLEGFTSGNIDFGISNLVRISSSHSKVWILNNMVLEALV